MKYCDQTSKVLRWASEEVVIPYINPIDKKTHRYFVDFLIELTTPEGVKTWLVEIKPKKQCSEPEKKKRITKGYVTEVKTWITNKAKWEAARKTSEARGWDFKILTEDDLFRKTP